MVTAKKFAHIDEKQLKKITVIGLGYVGFPSYLLMLEKINVIGYDKNRKLLSSIRNGKYISKKINSNII